MDLRKHELAMLTDRPYARASNFLDRTDMLVKAGVNPFSDRKLLSHEQSESLAGILTELRAEHTGDLVLIAQQFRVKGQTYLQETTTETIFSDIIMPELKAATQRYYGAHKDLVHQPNDMPHAERVATSARIRPSNGGRRGPVMEVTATGDMLKLYTCFRDFMDRYKLNREDIGKACLGGRNNEPLSATAVSACLSQLAHGNGIHGVFRYIDKDPDAFFARLEQNNSGITAPPEARQELREAVSAAMAELSTQKLKRSANHR